MKVSAYLFLLILLVFPGVSVSEPSVWPQIEATLSEDFLNQTLANTFTNHPTIKSLRFEFRPLEREVYFDLYLNISLTNLIYFFILQLL